MSETGDHIDAASHAHLLEAERRARHDAERALALLALERDRLRDDIVVREKRFRESEKIERFLAEASRILSQSLDYETTLSTVARLAVPTIADWCGVEILDENGHARPIVIAHNDPEKQRILGELRRMYPPETLAEPGFHEVLRTGRSVLIPSISHERLEQGSANPEHLKALEALGFKSAARVAMKVRDRLIGVITLAYAESGRHYEQADLAIAEDLATRAALAVDNSRLFSEAQNANRRKDEFLAMLAHELRNPLAPALTALELMRRKAGPDAPLERERAIAERQILHMTRLVDDLLDVSRITQGKVELKLEDVRMETVIARAVEEVRPLVDSKRHFLRVSVEQGLVVHADADRLKQVLSNLLNNAAKYTGAGGHIDIDASASNGEIVLRVRDDGIGIAPDAQAGIFELFVQGPRSIDRSQGGLGIGLTIVRSLAEMHGGRVEVRSEGPGKGSEFIVRMPARHDPGAAATRMRSEPSLEHRLPGGLRVLVVDDNTDAGAMLGDAIEHLGHEARVEVTARACIATALEWKPDTVLIDIGLPEMDGYQVAETLRAKAGPHAPFLIAVTGYGQDRDRARSVLAGFDRHLLKPVSIPTLDKLLSEIATAHPRA